MAIILNPFLLCTCIVLIHSEIAVLVAFSNATGSAVPNSLILGDLILIAHFACGCACKLFFSVSISDGDARIELDPTSTTRMYCLCIRTLMCDLCFCLMIDDCLCSVCETVNLSCCSRSRLRPLLILSFVCIPHIIIINDLSLIHI